MSSKYLFLFTLLCCLSSSTKSQDNNAFIQQLIDDGNVINAVQEWCANVYQDPLLCIYYYSDSLGGFPFRVLSFYQRDSTNNYKEIFRDSIGYGLVGLFPMQDCNGNLLSIWMAGSAYNFRVYSYKNRTVRLELNTGSKMMPEIVYSNFDTSHKIIISHVHSEPEKKTNDVHWVHSDTDIYTWVKDHYEIVDVPYNKRFNFNKKWFAP
jgi:hypothetical protein